MNNKKLKSTTFWMSVTSIALNPIAWWYDTNRTLKLLEYMIENDISPEQMSFIFSSLPLTTIATATLAIVTAYVAGNKGRNIAENVKKPPQ